jgi:hypothetical protein
MDAGTLVCTAGFQDGNTAVSVCLFECSTNADCSNANFACGAQGGTSVCFDDYCDGSPKAYKGPPLAACNSAGSADGQCLYDGLRPLGWYLQQEAVCYQIGQQANGENCDYVRGGVGQCSADLYCYEGPTSGVCYQITVDGSCKPANQASLYLSSGADWGICTQNCTRLSDTSCPASQVCTFLGAGNGYTCLAK